MKKVILIACSLIISQISFAQTEFQAKVAKVLRFVERSIDIKNEVNKDFRLDFFVYDISLDVKGDITDIHLLILDSVRTFLGPSTFIILCSLFDIIYLQAATLQFNNE